MKTKIGALVATLAAAASAAAAALWARRKRDGKRLERKRNKPSRAKASSPSLSGAKAAAAAPAGSGSIEDAPRAASEEASKVAATGDLTSIKGLGARTSERLAEIGVTTLAQIAAWSDADIDEIAPRIHVGAERIRREDWVGQAQAATKG